MRPLRFWDFDVSLSEVSVLSFLSDLSPLGDFSVDFSGVTEGATLMTLVGLDEGLEAALLLLADRLDFCDFS